jgi:hypothetical protein
MPITKKSPIRSVVKSSRLSSEEQIAQRALNASDEALALVQRISTLQHADVSVEQSLVSFRNEVIKAGISEVHSAYDSIVEKAKSTYDEAKKKLNDYLLPWQKADELIRVAINDYYTMVKQVQRREQEKADREQAEKERLAAVQREQERLKLEKQIEKQIDSLPKKADPALIEKLLEPLKEFETPLTVAPPIIVSAPETSGAMSQTDNWKGKVELNKEMRVLEQIVAGELPISLIEFRAPELNKLAKLYQNKKKIDGLVFWNQPFVRGVGGR